MVAFSNGGDYTWTGLSTFSGGVSIPDLESTTLDINTTTVPSTTNIGSDTLGVNVYLRADDLQIEAIGNMRFDSAFGSLSPNVGIASSQATHLQLANPSCSIDMTCTSFVHAGSGLFAVNGGSISLQTASSPVFTADNAQNVAIAGSTIEFGIASTCTSILIGHVDSTVVGVNCSEFNVIATLSGGGIGVVNIGGELAINMSAPQTNIGDDAFVTALTLGQFTSAVTSLRGLSVAVTSASTMDFSATGDVNISSSGGGTLTVGNLFQRTNIYCNNMDFFCQGGTVTVNSSVLLQLGGALTNAIVLGDASVVPQVLAFNSPRTFVNSPSFLFQSSVVDLSGQATASSSGLKNVMMNLSGHLVVSTVTNPSQPFWVMGGNPAGGVPIFGTNVAGTGISMRASGNTFLSVVGASGNMTIQNTTAGTTGFTSVGALTISSASTCLMSFDGATHIQTTGAVVGFEISSGALMNVNGVTTQIGATGATTLVDIQSVALTATCSGAASITASSFNVNNVFGVGANIEQALATEIVYSASNTFFNVFRASNSGGTTFQGSHFYSTPLTLWACTGATMELGISSTNAINISNATCTTTIDATDLKLANYANAGAGLGTYTSALLGANKAYLVIDTVTGAISSVTPS